MAGPAATSVVSVYNQAHSTAVSTSSRQPMVTPTASTDISSNRYSAGTLAGVGAGIGVPLLLALLTVLSLLFKERKKNKNLENIPPTQHSLEKDGSDHRKELHAVSQPIYGTENAEDLNKSRYASYEIDGSHPHRTELPL